MNLLKVNKSNKKNIVFFLGFIIVISVLIFFWVLPSWGHRFLTHKNYYGMMDSEIFSRTLVDCSKAEKDYITGKFLGIYPYSANIIKECVIDYDKREYSHIAITISARAPHTFLTTIFESPEMKVSSYKVILHTRYEIDPKPL